MALKTDAEVTVVSEQLVIVNLGFDKIYKAGDTVRIPNHTATELEALGAVTIVSLGS